MELKFVSTVGAVVVSMMFVGTVKTDTNGQPLTDAATGQVIQESGGCSSPE